MNVSRFRLGIDEKSTLAKMSKVEKLKLLETTTKNAKAVPKVFCCCVSSIAINCKVIDNYRTLDAATHATGAFLFSLREQITIFTMEDNRLFWQLCCVRTVNAVKLES